MGVGDAQMRKTGGHGASPRPGDAERQPEAMAQAARPPKGETAPFAGRWANHLGSVLDLAVDGGSSSWRLCFLDRVGVEEAAGWGAEGPAAGAD